jgi:CBS domain-containing protein
MIANQRVGRVMTEEVLSIDVEESAGAVLRLFAGYPLHHLPVLNGQKVVGMLSSADVMKLEAFLPKSGVPADEYLDRRISIRSLLRAPVITIGPQQTLIEAARLMASHGFHALPVVDAQEHLLGIITTTDIMHAALQVSATAPATAPATATTGGDEALRDIRVSGAEFDRAIVAAKSAVGSGQDPQGVALVLLYLRQRLGVLERVLRTADRYFSCGQDQSLHAASLQAIAEAKRSMPDVAGEAEGPLGLA